MKNKNLVNFVPAPALVNNMIAGVMKSADMLSAQELATVIASQVASLAFVMCDSNSPERIKELFGAMIDDAYKQYENRKALMEKENSNVLRMKT